MMNDKSSTIKTGTRIKKVNRVRVDFKLHAHKRPDRLIQTNLKGSPKYSRSGTGHVPAGGGVGVGHLKNCAGVEIPGNVIFISVYPPNHGARNPPLHSHTSHPPTSHPNGLQLPSSCVLGRPVPYGERGRDRQLFQTRLVLWGSTPGGGLNHSTGYFQHSQGR